MSTRQPAANCSDDFDPNSLDMDEALRRVESAIEPLTGFETVFIRDSLDRILAEDVLSPLNVPAYANSAMDGYAVAASSIPTTGTATLKVATKIFAGHAFDGTIKPNECARIMTGAPVPDGCDTVIMQEHVEVIGDEIIIASDHKPGQNVRHAGEDIKLGGIVLQQGRRIIPADLGLLASLGIAEIRVKRTIRAAFFSTGDELRSLGESLEKGQIYDSNRYTLFGMLKRAGLDIIDIGVIPDTREAIKQAFLSATTHADLLITTGGVSVGEADFVKETLEELGQVNFWKIAMKPGRPLAFGKIDRCTFFGLPGNPVSAMVTFYQYVLPGIRQLAGETMTRPTTVNMKCAHEIKKRPGRVEFQRGIMEKDESGHWEVRTTGPQGSHVLSSMSQANCFIVLPMASEGIKPGEMVSVQPFYGLI